MPSKYELCSQCGSILKTSVCMKCGFDATATDEIIAGDENNDLNESLDVKPIPEKIEAHEQVSSIFNDIAAAGGIAAADTPLKIKRKYLSPVILSILFLSVVGVFYWRFVYFTPDYVSPLVLSAQDIKAFDGAVESTASASDNPDNAKTIDLDTGLDEGNFATGNFAQFGAPGTKVFAQAFNIKNIFGIFKNEDVLKEIQDTYSVSDDDLDVYFSKGVAYFVPGDNLETWGFAIGVNDKDYVQKRLDSFKTKKADAKYKYNKYSADLVKIVPGAKVGEATPSFDINETNDNNPDAQYYLLISNSNEYLDQMRESSEGNLTNLANEAKYARSKADLPQVGEVLVYMDDDAPVWSTLADIVASKYSYIGLDKILKTIESTGTVFYSVNSKLRISQSVN